MSSVDSITITSVSTVNQIEITSTSGITVTTVGTQGLAGPSAIMQKGVDATTIGSNGNGTFLVYDHANTQWTSSGSSSVANLTVEIQKLRIGGTGATVVSILDEDNMSSNSATSLATQQSIKAYVESRVGIDNLAALLASGNTTGGTNIVVSANDDITFTDTSKGLFGNSSDLQIYHDGTHSYIANSQGALKVATETSGITVNIGHTTSTVAIGDDLTVAGNQSITGTLGVTGTITGSLTGNVTGQVSDISNFTTANITENTNLYYTNERVDDQVNSLLVGGTGIILTYDDNAGTLTIDGQIGDITSVVAGDGLSGGGSSGDVTLTVNVDNASVEINSDTLRVKASGITNDMLAGSITNSKLANADFTINSNSLVLGNSLTLDTDDIGEGTNNQYYTTSRANSDFDTRLATKTTDNLTEGSSRLYFTTARANTAIDNRVTKSFVDNLGVEASSVTANSVALGTDTTGNYIQTISGTANKITVSGSGSESADVTLTLPDDVQIADSLTVAGNLTVNGTLTSLDTTNLDIEDNLFQLNAGLTGSPVNDSGMLINRGNQNNGIFMWDESVDKFTMGLTTANGSATGNITLASLGTLVVNVEGNLTGAVTGNSSTATTLQTPRSIALSGDVSASAVNFDGSGNITLTTTIEANSIALGTDTVGNYVASITGGTGVTITGGTGESSTPSVAIGQAVGTTDDVTFNQVTADIIGNIEGATEFEASAGEALSKGDAVYISGVSGNKPVVSKADSDDANKMPSFGLAKTDANLNANVSVVTFGTLAGLNTSSFSVGDTLYISTTAGGLTASAPTGESSLIQNIGKVQRSHASAGSIKVGGAGRTNATPNLNDGKIFLGNGSNQSVSTTLDSSIVPENTNLYYTDARVQAVSINNVVEDTTPQLGGDLASNGNDILFGDSDKAVFGAGSDLEIYHDGSDSYIKEKGNGVLNISGGNAINFLTGNTADETGLTIGTDGAVTLYHNNAPKLATTSTGIDVTGTATVDGLTVDGIAEISSTTPTLRFFETDQTDEGTLLRSAGDSFQIAKMLDTGAADGIRLAVDQSSGDISFYEDTGTTAKFFWDASAESLGIGDIPSSIDGVLAIRSDSDSHAITIYEPVGANENWQLGVDADGDLGFYNSGSTTASVTFHDSGNVGIGTDSPDALLDIGVGNIITLNDTGSSTGFIGMGSYNDGTKNRAQGGSYYGFGIEIDRPNQSIGFGSYDSSGGNTFLTLKRDGKVGIGTDSPSTALHVKTLSSSGAGTPTEVLKLEVTQQNNLLAGDGTKLSFYVPEGFQGSQEGAAIAAVRESGTDADAATSLTFYTAGDDSSVSEAMTINSSRKVGIGTTSPSANLHVGNTGGAAELWLQRTDGYNAVKLYGSTLGDGQGFKINVNNQDRFAIDSSGKVGIGTDSPAAVLEVKGSPVATGDTRYELILSEDNTASSGRGGGLAFARQGVIYGGIKTLQDTSSDSNASMYFQTVTGGSNTTKMELNSSGNLGIGVNPSEKLHIRDSSTNADVYIKIANDSRDWFMGVEGSNSDILSFKTHDASNLLNITSSGKVGIGITPTEGKLHIKSDGSGEVELLTLENSTGTNGKTTLTFKTTSTDSTKSAQIFAERVNASGHTDLAFRTYNGSTTEAARIDHDGNLLVGKAVTSQNTAGTQISSTAGVRATVDDNVAAILNRTSEDGDIVSFRKDGSEVGSIVSRAGLVSSIVLDPRASGSGLTGTSDAILPTEQTGTPTNNNIDLGNSSLRFKDIYLGGGVYVGGTGSANKLDDYEEGYHNYTVVGSVSGSWTPRSGWTQMAYTKVGRLVTVTGQIEISGSSAPSGDARISLPFAVASTNAQFSVRTAIGLRNQGQSQSGVIYADAVNANAYFRIVQITDSGSLSFLSNSTLDASWEFNFSMTYMTA